MKISIIIATHNAFKSLPETVSSILSQNFSDYEVVIIDGASVDGTLDLIRGYEQKFGNKLRWISEKDGGVYYAMNKGIDLSKGEWLYFLGAGDILFKNDVLKEIAEDIADGNSDVVYGNVERGLHGKIYDREFDRNKLIKKNISHQAIFYKRRVFDVLGKYNTRYKTLADWEFNMRLINREDIKVKYIDKIIATFEIGGISKTRYDKEFYEDFEDNVGKYFPRYSMDFYSRYKAQEIRFVKSKFHWKLWELKNKVKFVFCSPKKFIEKYIKK